MPAWVFYSVIWTFCSVIWTFSLVTVDFFFGHYKEPLTSHFHLKPPASHFMNHSLQGQTIQAGRFGAGHLPARSFHESFFDESYPLSPFNFD